MSKYILPLFFVLIAVALYVGLTQPLLTHIDAQKVELASISSAVDTTSNLAKIKEDLLAKFNTITTDQQDRLTKLVPDQIDNVRFIIDVNNVASRFGMHIQNLQLSSAAGTSDSSVVGPDGKTYGSLTLGFDVTGSYTTMRAFLSALDASLRLVDVQSVSFNANDNDKNTYTVLVRTYWLKSL